MIIEHVFVTTRKSEEVLPMISVFLADKGFESTVSAFQVSQGQGASQWKNLQMRMKPVALKQHNLKKITCMLNLEYDRGRITMAVSLVAKRESFSLSGKDSPNSKIGKTVFYFGSQICNAVEHLASTKSTREMAEQVFSEGRDELANHYARQFRNNVIAFFGIVVFFILLILLIAFLTR